MAKGYWVVTYRSIKNAGAFEAYAKRAVPALQAEGGRFIVRGMPTKIYEAGMNERVVVIEFDDIANSLRSCTRLPPISASIPDDSVSRA
jgi:uncharacterized protein (DUF1330 family)